MALPKRSRCIKVEEKERKIKMAGNAHANRHGHKKDCPQCENKPQVQRMIGKIMAKKK